MGRNAGESAEVRLRGRARSTRRNATRVHHRVSHLCAGSRRGRALGGREPPPPRGPQRDTRTLAVARAIENAAATLLNTGIGWHEARVPTIAQAVPRAGFAWAARRIKQAV